MGWDIAILVGITLCQGATGYWAFHVSTADPRRRPLCEIDEQFNGEIEAWRGDRLVARVNDTPSMAAAPSA